MLLGHGGTFLVCRYVSLLYKFCTCIQLHLIMISLLYYFRNRLQRNSSFLSQRVNQCLRNACKNIYFHECSKLIDCGHGRTGEYQNGAHWDQWKENVNASACFTESDFEYGIYLKAVNLTTKPNFLTRYVYSSFWGFQVCLLFFVTIFMFLFYFKAFMT